MMNLNFFSRKTICVLGLPFDVVTTDEAVATIEHCCLSNTRCFLTTPNLNFAMTARSDEDFYQSVVASDLSVADGMPIVLLSRLIGSPLPERVAGSTLFEALSNKSPKKRKIRVYFFGGQKGVAEKAHDKLNIQSKGMESCGWFDPGFVSVEQMSKPEILKAINAAEPDFIVVALGAKKGQQWIMRNKDRLRAPVISHLGAVINFVAEEVNRAPVVVQKFGLEWLWRIKEEPGLWRRYWSDGVALCGLLATCIVPLMFLRLFKRPMNLERGTVSIEGDRDTLSVRATGNLTQALLNDLKEKLTVKNFLEYDLVIHFEGVGSIEPNWLAFLLLLQRKLEEAGKVLSVSDAPVNVAHYFRRQCVLDRLAVPGGAG